MAEELKPCPFCGGEATLLDVEASQASGGGRCFKIECLECGIETGQWDNTPDEALSRWNTRSDTNAELLEALQGLVNRSHEIFDEDSAECIHAKDILARATATQGGDDAS